MRQMKRVFADANGWIALNSRRDGLHDIAVRVNRDLLSKRCDYVTTNFVLDESVTSLLTNVGHFAAVDFGEKIQASKVVQIVHITEEIEAQAWEMFKRYSDKTFSFTDCTSFIVMQQAGLSEAFTSDHHFEQMGFTILLKSSTRR